jgi:ribosomal RNA-processing protein 8
MIPLPGDPGGRAAAPTDEVVGSSSTSGAGKKKKRALKAEADRVASEGRPEVVDVAVCCLSLMGINWVGGVYEACRVLRRG